MAVSILLNPRLRDIYATKRVHCVWKCFDDVALSEEKENGGTPTKKRKKKCKAENASVLLLICISGGGHRDMSRPDLLAPHLIDSLSSLSLIIFELGFDFTRSSQCGTEGVRSKLNRTRGENKIQSVEHATIRCYSFKSSKLV